MLKNLTIFLVNKLSKNIIPHPSAIIEGNICVTCSSKIELFCNLKNVKIIKPSFTSINKIHFRYEHPELTDKKIMKTDPTILLFDETENSAKVVTVPLPCNKYIGGYRYEVFEPFFAYNMLSHSWISDNGYVIIGNKLFMLDDPDVFICNEVIKKLVSVNTVCIDNLNYKTDYCLKDLILIVYKLKKIHTEIQRMKNEESS